MTDILKKLHQVAVHGTQEEAIHVMADAATEIARLNELLRGVGANRYWEGRWRDADAECEHLRALRPPSAPAEMKVMQHNPATTGYRWSQTIPARGQACTTVPPSLSASAPAGATRMAPWPDSMVFKPKASAPAGAQPSEEDVRKTIEQYVASSNTGAAARAVMALYQRGKE